jgi:hypothetical protein
MTHDSGAGDRVGCFQSRVIGVGPQVGFVIPMGTTQGYLNLALSQLLTTIVLLALYWIGKLRARRRFEPRHVNQAGDRTGKSGSAR